MLGRTLNYFQTKFLLNICKTDRGEEPDVFFNVESLWIKDDPRFESGGYYFKKASLKSIQWFMILLTDRKQHKPRQLHNQPCFTAASSFGFCFWIKSSFVGGIIAKFCLIINELPWGFCIKKNGAEQRQKIFKHRIDLLNQQKQILQQQLIITHAQNPKNSILRCLQ